VGRHLIVREIAKGTIGPLYLAHTQNADDTVETLARVIPLPADLPARDDQLIAEAIWDSANVGHDMVLRVFDVVAGKGWVTLVHDFQPGALISAMHRRAREQGTAFPPEVAARVALDVLEGLELSQGLCESNRIPWRPGSIALGSLYLCGDGRTRALDGQVIAAVMRSAQMRMVSGTSASVAPELLNEHLEPDERTDVFSVGTVLWELLTGRDIMVDRSSPVANVFAAVPRGIQVPQGLAQALHRAIELEPNARHASLRELAVALVMGAEKVATYEQVIEFARALLPEGSAFDAPVQPAPVPVPKVEAETPKPAPAQAETEVPAPTQPVPEVSRQSTPPAPRFVSPFSPAVTPMRPPAATPIPDENRSSERLAAASVSPIQAIEASATAEPSLVGSASEPRIAAQSPTAPDAPPIAPVASESTVQSVESPPTASASTDKAKPGRIEQISWPDDDSLPSVVGKPAASKPNGKKPLGAVREQAPTDAVNSLIELRAEQRTSGQAKAAKSSPRESVRPASPSVKPASATKAGSVRPKAAKTAERTEARLSAESTPQKKGGLQISVTTLILGFSTTVLAVVLIMLLMQRGSRPAPAPVAQPQVVPEAPAAAQVVPAEEKHSTADRNPPTRESVSQKATETKPPTALDTKLERHKRAAKSSTSPTAKSAGSDDDSSGDDSKTSKRRGGYVPSDL
jgi:hypothetical protein